MSDTDRVVIDASVAVKWVLPEDDSEQADRFLSNALDQSVRLLAPDIYMAEVANVLWVRAARRRDISAEHARLGLRSLLGTIETLVSSRALVPRALELSLTFGHPVYDCLYVALALVEQCNVVTADRRLVDTVGRALGNVVHLDEAAGTA
jgi:predicted nucleic acid-binding protein